MIIIGVEMNILEVLKLKQMYFQNIIIELVLKMLILNIKFINNITGIILTGMIVIMVVTGNHKKNFILSENEN
jgi:hypothetical protein